MKCVYVVYILSLMRRYNCLCFISLKIRTWIRTNVLKVDLMTRRIETWIEHVIFFCMNRKNKCFFCTSLVKGLDINFSLKKLVHSGNALLILCTSMYHVRTFFCIMVFCMTLKEFLNKEEYRKTIDSILIYKKHVVTESNRK